MRAISSALETNGSSPSGAAPLTAPWRPSLRIVLVYAVVLSTWIPVSDWAVSQLADDPQMLTRLQTTKGWLFTYVSSLLLFLLIKRTIGAMQEVAGAASEADALHASIFDRAPLGILIMDQKGDYIEVNQAFADLLGYPCDRLIGVNCRDVTHPADVTSTHDLYRILRAEPEAPVTLEKRYVRCDGSIRWAHVTASALTGAGQRYALAIVKDITERKRREEELRQTLEALRASQGERRELVAALLRAEERERQRIAADIHDDTLQVMTAVLMNLDLAEAEKSPRRRSETIVAASETLRRAVDGLRHLVFALRPAVLEQHGLAAALNDHLERAARSSEAFGWKVEYELEEELQEETRLLAYRTAREALVNAVKHAKPSRVLVRVEDDGDGVRFLIEDDGVGLDPAVVREERRGLGLGLMRERVELYGGTFAITSSPDRGTRVEFWLPRTATSSPPSGQMRLEEAPELSTS